MTGPRQTSTSPTTTTSPRPYRGGGSGSTVSQGTVGEQSGNGGQSVILRPYQLDAIAAIRDAYGRGHRAVLLVLPTGTGKTVVFAECARRAVAKGRRVLVLAHRGELLEQAAAKLAAVGVEAGVEKAGERAGDAPVVVASVQTLRGRRLASFEPDTFGLIIIDEAHHATAKSYRAILEHFGGARVLGVTATPQRGDGQALGGVFEAVAYRYELRQAIQDGHLVPIRCRRVEVGGLDLSAVRTRRGDLDASDLAALLDEAALHEIAAPLVELAGDRPTIAFTPDVATAEALAEILDRYRPGKARAVSGGMAPEARAEALADFAAGRLQYVTNCALLTEGFDAPPTSCVALVRPTKSAALFTQMIGRGTRLAPGKDDLLVLDFRGNAGRHRLVSAVDALAGREIDEQTRAEAEALIEADPQLDLLAAVDQAEAVVSNRAAELRLTAAAKFQAEAIDLFGTPEPSSAAWASDPATEAQRAFLVRHGFKPPEALTKGQASAIIETITERRRLGLATPKQVRLLARRGIDARAMTFGQAGEAISRIAANGWRHPRRFAA